MVTAMLLGLSAFEVLTGIFGILLYRWIPKTITRIEGESQVEEDVLDELESHEEGLARLRRNQELDYDGGIKALKAHLPGLKQLYSTSYGHETVEKDLRGRLGPLITQGGMGAAAVAKKLVRHSLRRRELRACMLIYRLRRGWLISHLGIMAALVALTLVHVVSVFFFWGGFSP